MHTLKARWIPVAVAIALSGAVLLLWSWNTIVALFGGPAAEFKHAVAALVFVGVARVAMSSTRGHRRDAAICQRHADNR